MKKNKKIVEQITLQSSIEVPYHVWVMFGQGSKKIVMAGDQASLCSDGDYGDLTQLRRAVEYYVDQLGGKVKWEK